MKLRNYDYFFIFFDKVISEDDYFMVCKLIELKKSFCLVRSKIDEDLANAEDDGRREEDVIPAVRRQIQADLLRYEHLKNSDAIFLISSRRKDIGEWNQLLSHIEKSLPPAKYESFIFALPTLTEDVIDKKYKILKRRIKIATVIAAGVAAIPIPGVDIVANIGILVEEIYHYIEVFGLNKKKLCALEGFDRCLLNCYTYLVPSEDFAKLILSQLGKYVAISAVESIADIFIPIIGSLISAGTSAVFTYRYLSLVLDNFRDDARVVYRYALKKHGI